MFFKRCKAKHSPVPPYLISFYPCSSKNLKHKIDFCLSLTFTRYARNTNLDRNCNNRGGKIDVKREFVLLSGLKYLFNKRNHT